MDLNTVPPSVVEHDSVQPAGAATQVFAFVTLGIAIAGVVIYGELSSSVFVMALLSLAGGIAVGLVTDLRSFSRKMPGIVVALLVLTGSLFVLALSDRTRELIVVVPFLGLFVLGLDWFWANRLRVVAWFSATVALVLAGQDPPGSLLFGLTWLVAVLVTHGLAERDIARARGLAPVWGTNRVPRDDPPPRSLFASIAVAVGMGLLFGLVLNLALLLASPERGTGMYQLDPYQQRVGGSGSGSGSGGGGSEVLGHYGVDDDGDGTSDGFDYRDSEGVADRTPGADNDSYGGSGAGEGSGSAGGTPCAEIRGCIAVPGNERIVVDSEGRVVVDSDRNGEYDVHEDGRLGVDEDGDGVIDSWNTRDIIVDADADGWIQIDDDGDGIVDRRERGSVGLDTNGDRVIDANGEDHVGVDTDGDGVIDTYDPGWIVLDRDGDELPDTDGYGRRLPTDPEVVIADRYDRYGRSSGGGQSSSGGQSSGGGQASGGGQPSSGGQPASEPPGGASGGEPSGSAGSPSSIDASGLGDLLIILAALSAAGVAAWLLYRWYDKRRVEARERMERLGDLAAKRWALSLSERLEQEGADRGRSRRRGESITTFARTLHGDVLPDDRVVEVGRLIDAELFGPSGVDAATRQWAEDAIGAACESFPPGWQEVRDDEGVTPEPAGVGS